MRGEEDYCPNLTGWGWGRRLLSQSDGVRGAGGRRLLSQSDGVGGGEEDYCPSLTRSGGKKITVPI